MNDYAVGEYYLGGTPPETFDGSLFHALRWNEADGAIDLNDLTINHGEWTLHGAFGISDTGLIVGTMFASQGAFHAFMLTPLADAIPEPATLALLGLAGPAFSVRKQ